MEEALLGGMALLKDVCQLEAGFENSYVNRDFPVQLHPADTSK